MKYELIYTKKAISDLEGLHTTEAQRIIIKLEYFIEQPKPLSYAKPLEGIYKGLFRFRIGDFRALFSRNAQGGITLLKIIRVQHRKNVYE